LRRALAVLLFLPVAGVCADDVPDQTRQAEILYLLKHDCGSCHGMQLTGGLGPALGPDRFRDRSVEQLAEIITQGRPGTPMPPWGPFLSEAEARWLAGQLINGVRLP